MNITRFFALFLTLSCIISIQTPLFGAKLGSKLFKTSTAFSRYVKNAFKKNPGNLGGKTTKAKPNIRTKPSGLTKTSKKPSNFSSGANSGTKPNNPAWKTRSNTSNPPFDNPFAGKKEPFNVDSIFKNNPEFKEIRIEVKKPKNKNISSSHKTAKPDSKTNTNTKTPKNTEKPQNKSTSQPPKESKAKSSPKKTNPKPENGSSGQSPKEKSTPNQPSKNTDTNQKKNPGPKDMPKPGEKTTKFSDMKQEAGARLKSVYDKFKKPKSARQLKKESKPNEKTKTNETKSQKEKSKNKSSNAQEQKPKASRAKTKNQRNTRWNWRDYIPDVSELINRFKKIINDAKESTKSKPKQANERKETKKPDFEGVRWFPFAPKRPTNKKTESKPKRYPVKRDSKKTVPVKETTAQSKTNNSSAEKKDPEIKFPEKKSESKQKRGSHTPKSEKKLGNNSVDDTHPATWQDNNNNSGNRKDIPDKSKSTSGDNENFAPDIAFPRLSEKNSIVFKDANKSEMGPGEKEDRLFRYNLLLPEADPLKDFLKSWGIQITHTVS